MNPHLKRQNKQNNETKILSIDEGFGQLTELPAGLCFSVTVSACILFGFLKQSKGELNETFRPRAFGHKETPMDGFCGI